VQVLLPTLASLLMLLLLLVMVMLVMVVMVVMVMVVMVVVEMLVVMTSCVNWWQGLRRQEPLPHGPYVRLDHFLQSVLPPRRRHAREAP
jgi:hypothetical protein